MTRLRGFGIFVVLVAVGSLAFIFYRNNHQSRSPGANQRAQTAADPSDYAVARESLSTFESGGRSIQIDQFLPQQDGKHPAVIILHGSNGWQPGLIRPARSLAAHGYIALIVHYMDRSGVGSADQAATNRHFVSWMRTVSDAVAHAQALPQADPGRVGLLGYSLGAYLALETAAVNSRVAAVVDYFGGMSGIIASGLERMPPTLILHGEADNLVPVEEAHRLERLFKAKHIVFESKIYQGTGHGFSGAVADDAWQRTLHFLDRYLNAKSADKPAEGRFVSAASHVLAVR
jgi:carboxymethylenebutenolidase